MDRVLIVDDEKNIRFTLSEAVATLPIEVETAEDGQQALQRVEEGKFALILLDLRMPEIDGMEVLRRLRDDRPEIPVVIITAHGNVESAVEAMKLGAIEFLQKPFVPEDIRAMVTRVLDRHKLDPSDATEYAACFELAKRCLSERHWDAAVEHLKHAIGVNPERPEAFNLLGAIYELRGDFAEAMKNYNVAWQTDPTFSPASENIDRVGGAKRRIKPINFGELRDIDGDK